MKKAFLPALFIAFFALSFQPAASGTTFSTTQTFAQDIPPTWVKVATWEVNGVRYTKWWTGTNYVIIDEGIAS